MENINYSVFRRHLAQTLNKVNQDHQPILITRQSGSSAVVMSLEDFNSYEETFYLLTSLANAKVLSQSISDLEAGNGVVHDLIEDGDE